MQQNFSQPLRFTSATIVLFPYLSGIYTYTPLRKREVAIEIPHYVEIVLDTYRTEGVASVHSHEVEPIFFTNKPENNKSLWKYLESNLSEFKKHIKIDIVEGNRKLWVFGNKPLLIDLYAELSSEKIPNMLFYKPDKEEPTKVCSIRTRFSKQYQTWVPILRDIEKSVICKN